MMPKKLMNSSWLPDQLGVSAGSLFLSFYLTERYCVCVCVFMIVMMAHFSLFSIWAFTLLLFLLLLLLRQFFKEGLVSSCGGPV